MKMRAAWRPFLWILIGSGLLTSVTISRLSAQTLERTRDTGVQFGVSFGRNQFGALLDVFPISRVALTGRIEGLPLADVLIGGGGIRVDIVSNKEFRGYVSALLGISRCVTDMDGGGCPEGTAPRRAIGGVVGGELPIDRQNIWALGFDAGYWSIRKKSKSGPSSQLDFNISVRVRP